MGSFSFQNLNFYIFLSSGSGFRDLYQGWWLSRDCGIGEAKVGLEYDIGLCN